MNFNKIRESYAPGDPQAGLMLRAAEQLDAAISRGPGWSMALAIRLFDLLSWVEFHFPDGTSLNVPDKYESIIGDTGAGLLVSAMDPEGRSGPWWEGTGHSTRPDAPEIVAANTELQRALANANIRLVDT
jgi:hypothetical protein